MNFSNNLFLYFSRIISVVSLVLTGSRFLADALCNVCQQNQAACINTTSYYLCFGETTPYTDVLYHCLDGFDCTDLDAICIQTNNARKPSCGDTSKCGLCSAHRNYLFACTSRNTFRMCYGASHPSGPTGYCPKGWFCDADSDMICVKRAEEVKELTCDIIEELPKDTTISKSSTTSIISSTNRPTEIFKTTTTSTILPETTTPMKVIPSTPPSSSSSPSFSPFPITPDEVCTLMGGVGLFPALPQDPRCSRYVYCYRGDGILKGIERSCPISTFYNIDREQCTLKKPPYCL